MSKLRVNGAEFPFDISSEQAHLLKMSLGMKRQQREAYLKTFTGGKMLGYAFLGFLSTLPTSVPNGDDMFTAIFGGAFK